VYIGGVKRTVLFDTGPEEDLFESNAKKLKVDFSNVEVIVLSHWHRDHSGTFIYKEIHANDYRWPSSCN
jgi:metal-dependent hydrolase (beta-lactamase superfamily II)